MHLATQESVRLEGECEVILEPQSLPTPPTIAPGDTVRLTYGEHQCGARVRDIREGSGDIRLDKHLRLFLRAPVGTTVLVEPHRLIPAESVELGVPENWATTSGETLLKGFLLNKPVAVGQKLPVFLPTGARVSAEVVGTNPSDLVCLAESTAVSLVPAPDEKSQGADTTYRDIGGLQREIARLRELVEYPLRHPQAFAQLGIEAPRGIVLYGPPGTGKTLIARALSNELGATFFTIAGPEIVSSLYGESEKLLRSLFDRARSAAPALILIDELDALVPKRDEAPGELERRLVATLLALMDGLGDLNGVTVVGTTNRLDSIDVALRRAGRFEHEIHIGAPSVEGRSEILSIHTRRMPLDTDVDLRHLAERTPGFVGADLSALCREASYHALRRVFPSEDLEAGAVSPDSGLRVTSADFLQALQDVRPSAMRELQVEVDRDVQWDHIGGLDDVKQTVIENVIHAMQKPEVFRAMGIRPAKGLLLYGPPGTGKTMVAKAVATESSANFIAVRGPELRSKWFGKSEEKVRFIFFFFFKVTPPIVFFDEIDALAPARGRHPGALTDSIVNQLLAELDGVQSLDRVFVIAATNAPDVLDPALLRPGRLDLKVLVPLPDAATRERIFFINLQDTPVDPSVDLASLAQNADGFSGAEIAEMCRLAALFALRSANFNPEGLKVAESHFRLAFDDVKTKQQSLGRTVGFE